MTYQLKKNILIPKRKNRKKQQTKTNQSNIKLGKIYWGPKGTKRSNHVKRTHNYQDPSKKRHKLKTKKRLDFKPPRVAGETLHAWQMGPATRGRSTCPAWQMGPATRGRWDPPQVDLHTWQVEKPLTCHTQNVDLPCPNPRRAAHKPLTCHAQTFDLPHPKPLTCHTQTLDLPRTNPGPATHKPRICHTHKPLTCNTLLWIINWTNV